MQIIRSYRRSISLMVDEKGEVVIRAPLFLSMKKIEEFAKSKENWVRKQQEKIKKTEEISNKYDFKNNVYVNNTPINFEEIKLRDKRVTRASFYSKIFYEKIIEKADKIAKRNNLNATFKLCNSKNIWGSCNQKNIIKLNWKIVILPEEIQNYIICHELGHIIQMNHSKKFWSEVEKMDMNYKDNRKKLKEYSFLLNTQILN